MFRGVFWKKFFEANQDKFADDANNAADDEGPKKRRESACARRDAAYIVRVILVALPDIRSFVFHFFFIDMYICFYSEQTSQISRHPFTKGNCERG